MKTKYRLAAIRGDNSDMLELHIEKEIKTKFYENRRSTVRMITISAKDMYKLATRYGEKIE